MFCPNCGTENSESNKFCMNCGNSLSTLKVSAAARRSSIPPKLNADQYPLSAAATTGGLIGIIGGAAVLVGWLLPWFDFGKLLGPLLEILGLGLGLFGLPAFVLSARLGSGLQFSLAFILLSIAAFSSSSGSDAGSFAALVLGLIVLGLGIVFISIPIVAITFLRAGIRMLESRKAPNSTDLSKIGTDLQMLRGRSAFIFVFMSIIFFIAVAITGTLFFSQGFYLTSGGAAAVYLGAIFAKSQFPQLRRPSNRPDELTQDEKEVLKLLADNLPNVEIANKLGVSPIKTSMLKSGLMEKLGAVDEDELIRKARMVIGQTSAAGSDSSGPKLSEFERKILQAVADGVTDSEIAAQMETSVRTVNMVLLDLLPKFHATNKAELVERAVAEELVTIDQA